MKTYEAIFETNNRGVYSISLVGSPAMEGNFIALSKAKNIELKAIDDEKKILVGLVLEPNKPVYRNQDGEEFNIVFSEKTITELMYNFQKQGYQTNSSIEHRDIISGVSFVEQWQVRDEKIDTSVALGLHPKKGSWVAVMKCDNDDIYQKAKRGEVKGFSIDAFVTLKEIKLNKTKKMENKFKDAFEEFKTELKSIFSKKENLKLGSEKTKVDGADLKFDGEELKVGIVVWVDSENGDKISLEEGMEIPMADERIVVIGKDSIVSEIKDASPDAQKPTEETMASEQQAPNKQTIDTIKSILVKYYDDNKLEFERLEKKLEKIVKENLELKNEVLELSKQPASKPIKTIIKQVELTAKGRMLEAIRNQSKN